MLFICIWALPCLLGQIKFRLYQIPAKKQTAELRLLLWQETLDPSCSRSLVPSNSCQLLENKGRSQHLMSRNSEDKRAPC